MAISSLPAVKQGNDVNETVENLYNAYYKLLKELQYLEANLDSDNVTSINTNLTRVSSNDGETVIKGPLLLMSDKLGNLRLEMGYDETSDKFLFKLLNANNAVTVGIDDLGNATFTGTIVGSTVRAGMEGENMVLDSDGLVGYGANGKRNGITVEKCAEEGFSNFYGCFFYVDDVLAGGLTMNMEDGRLWLKTNGEYILKIKSRASDMSIGAGNGKTIFIAADQGDYNNVEFGGHCKFGGSSVEGLEKSGYIKGTGVSGSFTSSDGKTVSVSNGLITSIA
jgi:hypothetical protein